MLRMFGLGEGEKNELGWGQADHEVSNINVSSFIFSICAYAQKTSSGKKR
jgi:hypothetical protein